MLIKKTGLTIYFGDTTTAFPPQAYHHIHDGQEVAQALFNNAPEHPKSIIVQKQTHSANGYAVSSPEDIIKYAPYTHEGDYLITNQTNVALGVATADCMPIIMHDPIKQALAVIHAGWRGTTQQIALKALAHLTREYTCNPQDIHVYFGPCARSCCYTVQESFITNVPQPHTHQRGNVWFCDLVGYQKDQLITAGIIPDHINEAHALCTICTLSYASYRREKEQARRNMSYAMLV